MPMIPKKLFPEGKIKDLKPGDMVMVRVSKVSPEDIDLDYSTVTVSKMQEKIPMAELEKMAPEALEKEPLDMLERSLPKAERE